MRYIFAGDRQISCNILKFLIDKGFKPSVLLVTDGPNSTHSNELIKISGLNPKEIFVGQGCLKDAVFYEQVGQLEVDYVIGIHYPYLIPIRLLQVPSIGVLNLHPAYLPYNKGWHTPSWAIIDKSKYGATLHFMSEKLDEGDIVHQKEIDIRSFDTANSLYKRVLSLEEEVFVEAFEGLTSLNPLRKKQNPAEGSNYKKADLNDVRRLDLDSKMGVRELLDRLRALTTNDPNELAFFEDSGRKIGVKVEFFEIE